MGKSLTLHDADSLDAGRAARKRLCEHIVTCPTALNILRNAGATLAQRTYVVRQWSCRN